MSLKANRTANPGGKVLVGKPVGRDPKPLPAPQADELTYGQAKDKLYTTVFPENKSGLSLEQLISKYDFDHSGKISADEFNSLAERACERVSS